VLCQVCQKREAEVHIQEVIGSTQSVLHLCAQCAKSNNLDTQENNGLKLAALAYKLAVENLQEELPAEATEDSAETVCPRCGTTSSEFSATGRLGCATCYAVFDSALRTLLHSMHAGLQHCGKLPSDRPGRPGGAAERESLVALERELSRAVNAENYERAAALRDRIRRVALVEATDPP
jgi:protein arginine kinase activator